MKVNEQTTIKSSNNIFEEAKAEPNKVKQSPLQVEQKKVVSYYHHIIIYNSMLE